MGTADPSDDRIVGGSVFEFRQDDGDGIYEPDTDDAPVLATVPAPHGFAKFSPPGPGDFWVTESVAPPRLDTAPPKLVTYASSPDNCTVLRTRAVCSPDDDASGGFVVVAVFDSPTQGVLPTTGTPPATSTAADVPTAAASSVWLLVVAFIAATGAGLSFLTWRRRTRRS